MIHPMAWISWLTVVVVALSTMRNPLHLCLVVVALVVVDTACQSVAQRLLPIRPWRLIALFTVVSALLNALSVRYGATALVHVPNWVPLLGGAITLEAFVFGALTGVTLAGLIIAFGTVQRSLPVSILIGLIPPTFYSAAVVTTIALTYVPTTLRQIQHIYEAQAIRGLRIRRLQDWIPLIIPLLIAGLERALQLAESMAARGFAHSDQPRTLLGVRVALVTGLTALLIGWMLVLVWGNLWIGQGMMVLGGLLLLFVLWYVGRRVPHTRYRHIQWSGGDSAVVIGACVLLAALWLPIPTIDRTVLAYYPYPRLQLPPFDPLIGFATFGLLWPAIVMRVIAPTSKHEESS